MLVKNSDSQTSLPMAVIHTAELGPRKWPFPQAPQVNSLVRCSQTAHQYVSLQTGKQKYHVTIHSPKNTNKIAAFKPRPISILLSPCHEMHQEIATAKNHMCTVNPKKQTASKSTLNHSELHHTSQSFK